MFRRLPDAKAAPVTLEFEGRPVTGQEGDSVAAVILAADEGHFRTTPVSGTPRAAYCMMGACFECLVVIDGEGNRQACQVPARSGMRVARQVGRRAPAA